MIRASNATNVRLFDGGLVIKQGDASSRFGFELLDENKRAIDLSDKTATVYLVHRTEGKWSQKVAIEDGNRVSFAIEDVLPLGRYVLEIHAGGYVFPSDRSVVLTLVKSEVTYATEDVVKLKELDVATIIKEQLAEMNLQGVDDERIVALIKANLSKQELDVEQVKALIKDSLPAGYDDTQLKAQISQILGQIATLNGRVDDYTPYDDKALREAVSGLESKVDNLSKVDTSNFATKAELEEVRGRQPLVDNLATKKELESYAKKSDLPKPYNDSPVQEFIAKEPQRRLEIEAGMRQEMQAMLANQPDGSKFGKNLLKDSGVWYSNKSYPTTSYLFHEEPVAGKTYTLTFKASLGAGKNFWSVQLRNGEGRVGAVARSASGIYQIELVWPKKKGTAPLEMQFYAAPNNGAVSTIEWVKLVEGKDTDLAWYPSYDEVVDKYSMGRSVAQALTVSSNLLDGTAGEKVGASEFLSYMDIAPVLDAHGTGVYTLSFDVKAAKAGKLTVYFSGSRKYQFLLDQVDVTTDWQRMVLPLDIFLENAGNKNATLSFFGTYGTGVIPTVRRVRLSKGDFESLEWRPSDKELAEIYAKLM